jgi:large subunit ribosomal protein L2
MTPFFKQESKFYLKRKNKTGRSKQGSIILNTRCSNKYNKFFSIDINRNKLTSLALIISLNYLNKNSCFIGLIKYANNSLSYIKLVNGLFIGNFTKSIDMSLKYSYNFKNILGGFIILNLSPKNCVYCNIVALNQNKSLYAKSAGTYLSIYRRVKEYNIFILNLPTGVRKYFSGDSKATVGRNSNFLNKYTCIGKAGINVNKGFKPSVRGIAMNPVDHPHGGRTKTNQPEMSP